MKIWKIWRMVQVLVRLEHWIKFQLQHGHPSGLERVHLDTRENTVYHKKVWNLKMPRKQLSGRKIERLKLLFEGASPRKTRAMLYLNPFNTILPDAQDKLLVRSGDMQSRSHWMGRQDQGGTRQSGRRDTHPGLGCVSVGGGDSLTQDVGSAMLGQSGHTNWRDHTMKCILLWE